MHSPSKELFWYVFGHIMLVVAVCFASIGVTKLKENGIVHENFPDFQRDN